MDESWYHEVWSHPANASGLTRLEVITGWTTGIDTRAPDIASIEPRSHPVPALERALLPAVARSPCYVAFSGGRDSSVLLALATRVARREGLDDPIPLTMRFRDVPEGEESAWQVDVVEHLKLREWKVVEQAEDIDLIGAEWRSSLRANGLQWPPAAHGLCRCNAPREAARSFTVRAAIRYSPAGVGQRPVTSSRYDGDHVSAMCEA